MRYSWISIAATALQSLGARVAAASSASSSSSSSSSAAATPSASIAAGTVTGAACSNAPDAVYFKSIPFAKPPTGALRFAPPQPYNQTFPGGTLNATQPSINCIQFGEFGAIPGPAAEDCLYLDIWAPANATSDSALPVRVWLYGGSNVVGANSDPEYDGCEVPHTQALMVAPNYRLGPLGYLTVSDAGLDGNQGIQDILLALQWVQDNIAAFGGDPKKVMLHGQSTGAANTYIVASLPQAPKLMSAAIMESGGGRDTKLKSAADVLGNQFAQALNCSTSDASCFRNASVDALQKVYNTLPSLNSETYGDLSVSNVTSLTFDPHVDGTVIPQSASEKGVQVPAIFGSNKLEGTLGLLAQFAAPSEGNPAMAVNQSVYDTFLQQNFGPEATKLVEQALPISAFNSTPFPAYFALAIITAQAEYQCPAERGLKVATANGVPVWTYYFSHNPSCSWIPDVPQQALPILSSAHTAEIPFVMGQTSHLPLPNGTCTMSPDEMAISKFMSDAWTMMAAAQKPTSNTSAWPAFDPKQSMGLQIVNSTAPGYINYTVCELWDEINAMAANGSSGNGSSQPPPVSSGGGSGDSGGGNGSSGSKPSGAVRSQTHTIGGWIVLSLVTASLLML